MNFRVGAAALLGISFALTGCAGGGASSGSAPTPSFIDVDNLPAWVQALPDGTPPIDNAHTQQTALYLLQASQAQNPEQAQTRFRSALDAALAGIEAEPENAQSYLQAGEAYIGLKEYQEGIRMLERAEELYPRYALESAVIREGAWVDLYQEGSEAYDAGNVPETVRLFEIAHDIYQWRPEAAIRLAGLYAETGRLEDSARMFGETVEIINSPQAADMDQELRDSWVELEELALANRAQVLYQLGDFEGAAEAFGAVYEFDSENLTALSNQAIAYIQGGMHDRAQAVYDRLLALPGLSARDYFLVGMGLYESDQFVRAAEAFAQSEAIVPQHRESLFLQAQALVLAEEWDKVLEVTERLLEIETHNTFVFRFRARALVEQERQSEAMEYLEYYEDLPFEVDGLRLQPLDDGYALTGLVFNRGQPEGTEIRLRVHFYSVSGESVGSEDVTVRLGPISDEEGAAFQVNLTSSADVFGYRYQVL